MIVFYMLMFVTGAVTSSLAVDVGYTPTPPSPGHPGSSNSHSNFTISPLVLYI